MKFILLLALVAVCYAYPHLPTRGRRVDIEEDGTIVLTGDNGKKIIISKTVGGSGQQNIDISVSGPNGITKQIQIDDNDVLREVIGIDDSHVNADFQKTSSTKGERQSSQGEKIIEILGQYQGDVDELTLQQLLRQINAAVRSGQLDGLFYEVLKNLGQDQSQDQERQVYNQQQNQGIIGNQLQKQHNILDLLLKQGIQQRNSQQYQQGLHRHNGVQVSMMTPINDQQQSLVYQQEIYNPFEKQEGMLVGNRVILPVMDTQNQVLEQIGLEQPQVIGYSPAHGVVLYELKRSTGPAESNIAYITSAGLKDGETTLVQVPAEDLLNTYGTQNIKQVAQPAQTWQLIQKDRKLLDQQRQMNQKEQQNLQQYHQQQKLLQQFAQQVPVEDLLNTYGTQNINQIAQPAQTWQLTQKERELLDQQEQMQQQMNQQQYQKEQQSLHHHQQQKLLQQFAQEQLQMQQNGQQQKINHQYKQQLLQHYLQQQQQPFTYLFNTSPRLNTQNRMQTGGNGQQQHIVPLVVY